jgi:hypothetical protein
MEEENNLSSELETVQKLVTPDEEADIEEIRRLKGRQLDDALYAALLSRAHSDQARALVDTVVTMIAEHELAAGIRTNKRDIRIVVFSRDSSRVRVLRHSKSDHSMSENGMDRPCSCP